MSQVAEDFIIRRGTSVPGLLLFRLILRDYATSRKAEIIYNIVDLQKLKVGGNMENFLWSWEDHLLGMHEMPNDASLEVIFYNIVKDYKGNSGRTFL